MGYVFPIGCTGDTLGPASEQRYQLDAGLLEWTRRPRVSRNIGYFQPVSELSPQSLMRLLKCSAQGGIILITAPCTAMMDGLKNRSEPDSQTESWWTV